MLNDDKLKEIRARVVAYVESQRRADENTLDYEAMVLAKRRRGEFTWHADGDILALLDDRAELMAQLMQPVISNEHLTAVEIEGGHLAAYQYLKDRVIEALRPFVEATDAIPPHWANKVTVDLFPGTIMALRNLYNEFKDEMP